MTTKEKEPRRSILSTEESSWIIKSFLYHPERVKKGATQEEISKVINWAAELKLDAVVKVGILHGLYEGTIITDLHDDGKVYMSARTVPVDDKVRDPEKYLNLKTLLNGGWYNGKY